MKQSVVDKIYNYYLIKAQEVVSKFENPNILKLDVANERKGLPKEGGIAKNLQTKGKITLIEINDKEIDIVKKKFPDLNIIIKGDIRKMPFKSETFDVLLDLSTLDHIPIKEIDKTVGEYCRVLKLRGLLLLIVWCSEDRKFRKYYNQKAEGFNKQWYFPLSLVKKIVKKRFSILEEEVVYRQKKGTWQERERYLYCIIAKKAMKINVND